ncbi:ABC transporter permease [Clostridium aestuarii]|uniref:ABC transporter permease n=2 Tax=Clostridium aestuarii TaxID=338193 RepID=A0ABT4D0M5_9CLOT|nr:ABC transporter permease [Clostridium aestuarii]MCY6484789.1 ABC transporter permease [Clostridium aestuarii]
MDKTIKKKRKKKSNFSEIMKRLSKSRMAMAGLVIIGILILTAIFAKFIAPYGYDEQNLDIAFQSPSAVHLFGTDEFGRDIFSRIVYGSRISLEVGFIAVSISVIIGGFLGAVAGYYGGKMDNLIMRAMDILLSIPQILLAISIAASLGPGLVNLMIAVGISSIPQYARIVRASVLSIRDQEFVEAAKAVGSSDLRIICKHILPNCLAPIMVQATLGVAFAILTAAGLSFIGLGIQPPIPEWGAMLSGGRGYIRDYSYMTLFPGLAIMITILALNFLGDGLRDALDPKLKN